MKKTLRVLSIEDSKVAAEFLERNLTRAGFALIFERVETPAELKTALETKEWDVVLCDYLMPQFNAPAALALVKEMGLDIPFIIISGTIGEEVAVKLMQSGAHDYLMKDNLARLVPTIEHQLEEAKHRRARKFAEDSLKASDAELRALLAALSDVIFELDAEGRYLKIAPTNPTYLYQSSADLLGKTLHEVFAKEKADFLLECIRRTLDEGRKYKVEYSLQIAEAEVWFEGSISPMSDDSVVWIAHDISERKRTQEALKASEAELRALFEAMTDVIFVLDSEGRCLRIAPTDPTHLYESSAILVGKTLHEIYPKPKADLFLAHIRQVLDEGERSNIEYSLPIKGSELWFDGSVSPITSDSVLWIARDITERKLAENQLRLQLDFTEAITISLGEGVYALDQHGRLIFMNLAAERALGWTRSELLGQSMHEIIHFQHADGRLRSADECPLLGVLRSGEAIEVESDVFTRKDGSTFPVSYSSSPIITRGQVVGAVLAFRDITERQRAEQELSKSEERYRDLVENARDIIYTHDLEGNYTSVNKASEQVTGYTREESLKMNMMQTVTPESLEKARQMLTIKIAGEEETIYDLEIITKDGRRIAVEVNTRLIFQDEVPIGVQGIARDVTERKHLEEQLRQSQKLEAVGQLAGGIAHDFNNLLTAIIGYSQLTLRQLQTEDPLRSNLEEIKRAGERAAALTRQLLAFSRKQVLQPKTLDLNAVVSEIEKMLQRLIGEDIELQTVLQSDLGSIKGDPGQIEQVLMNLAVNARDAMPQGGKLTIETHNVSVDEGYISQHIAVSPGPYVMLAVSDTGIGMDEQTQQRIFDPFFTTKELGKGTGLGLSTVYGIVKQSGGNIWVYSELGQGTTFKIYLPRLDEQAQESRPGKERQEAIFGKETILLAEDEEMVRSLMRNVLKRQGYEVLEAANGGAALLLCECHEGPIHLMITDVVMPEMSGRELTDRLTRLRPEMKVLFMSGYTDDTIVRHGILESDIAFLQKPFTPHALALKVRELLDQS